MELYVNPADAIDTLPCLNTCFPGWGDARSFEWAYQRQMQHQPPPDYLVLKEAGVVMAGSGISYRQVLLPNKEALTAGIMTGSWTMPGARGLGCFSRVIEESIRRTQTRGGVLLLAFVTEENASCRQLLRAGAARFPTSYLVSEAERSIIEGDALEEVELDTGGVLSTLDDFKSQLHALRIFFASRLVFANRPSAGQNTRSPAG